ncbi:MAG TPA: SPFH domain-containing protein [Ilumatobacteraceae bacterium]|nr:SPFH domain-containing protein [Ilumatobacteraceae bacterium]
MVALIIFLVIVIPVIGLLAYLFLDEAFVQIDSGKLGLVIRRGKATDKSLLPGRNFVPVLRKFTVEVYPSLELAYRAGDSDDAEDWSEFEHGGPALSVILGDRANVELSYTLRFRLDPGALKEIHERFGTAGIWSAIRDASARSLRATLSDPGVGIDDLFGKSRNQLEARLSESVASALRDDGFFLTAFSIGDVDLGRSGEVIQATVRARLELQRELAEAATRRAEVEADLQLLPVLGDASMERALRYREVGMWREFVHSPAPAVVVSPNRRPSATEAGQGDEQSAPAGQDGL